MKVTLLSHTPEPEKLIAAAAKLCYSDKADIQTLMDDLNDENTVNKFINKLIEMGHMSPLEHVNFTFAVEGISRATSHQLVRHRIASYTQRSQRYCSEDNFEYSSPEFRTEGAKDLYDRFMSSSRKTYQCLLSFGEKKEDARMVLPNAADTRIIFTMNARSLLHFFNVRCCIRAQKQIREMANEMLNLCKEVSPVIFNHAGASCVQHGYCPEGVMSCGKAPTMEQLHDAYSIVKHSKLSP